MFSMLGGEKGFTINSACLLDIFILLSVAKAKCSEQGESRPRLVSSLILSDFKCYRYNKIKRGLVSKREQFVDMSTFLHPQ